MLTLQVITLLLCLTGDYALKTQIRPNPRTRTSRGLALIIHPVSDTISLYDKVSRNGNNKMPNGETAELSTGTYTCPAGGQSCHNTDSMLATQMSGNIVCTDDDATCVLNGEFQRRGIDVEGTGGNTLTVKALTFFRGQTGWGGGINIFDGAIVNVVLSKFTDCRSTSTDISYGGGAMRVDGSR